MSRSAPTPQPERSMALGVPGADDGAARPERHVHAHELGAAAEGREVDHAIRIRWAIDVDPLTI